jgi:hypothetical protein
LLGHVDEWFKLAGISRRENQPLNVSRRYLFDSLRFPNSQSFHWPVQNVHAQVFISARVAAMDLAEPTFQPPSVKSDF